MYSGSRGILYTAPPTSDELNDDDATTANTTDDDVATTANTTDDDAAMTATEADDGLTADD